jgi:lipooligosaccharide transport system ATP-binding protein
VIEIAGVEKAFRYFRLADLTLDVEPGQVVGLVGPNGAGKSTTIRILMGLTRQDRGDVRVLGRSMPRDQALAKRDVGFISEDMRLYGGQTLAWHIRFVRSLCDSWDPAYADALLKRFYLQADRPLKGLSHGERVKATLLLALARRPRLLLLDEPTTGLDPQARHLVWDRLYRLKQRGVTLVLTTHYMDEAEQLCDRLVVMDKAEIVAEGSPRDLIDRYSTREVTELRFPEGVQETLDGQLDGIGERIERLPDRILVYAEDGDAAAAAVHARGLQPETVLVRRSSLEDVFLRLTGRSLIE